MTLLKIINTKSSSSNQFKMIPFVLMTSCINEPNYERFGGMFCRYFSRASTQENNDEGDGSCINIFL